MTFAPHLKGAKSERLGMFTSWISFMLTLDNVWLVCVLITDNRPVQNVFIH